MARPINDLLRHYRAFSAEIDLAVARVLASGWYINGAEVKAFESEFAAYCGVDHCIGVGNGTDALEIALTALGIQPGDEVLTVANAGGFASHAIHYAGATPIYVDVDPVRLTLSAEALERSISPKSRA